MVHGECPEHGSSPIDIHGLRVGSAQNAGDNFIEREMKCGDVPVGVTQLWVNLKQTCVMAFTMKVHCYNCRKRADVVLLMNKLGLECREIKSQTCCDRPILEYVELSARLLKYGDRTLLPLDDITFAPPRPSNFSPQPGILQVFPMNNKWVALQGPQQDYYARVQMDFQNRVTRVTDLRGPQHDHVEVQIVDETHLSLERFSVADITSCPACGEVIERDGGCDHMKCSRCSKDFNFSRKTVSQQQVY